MWINVAYRKIFRSRDVRYLIGAMLAVAMSRLIYRCFFGVRFNDSNMCKYMQIIDPSLLRSSLLASVFYDRDQPPLFNLFLGIVLKAFPYHSSEAFDILFLGCGLLLVACIFLLMRRLQVPPLLSAIAAVLFSANPTTVLYENLLFYTYPVALLMCLSALFLHRYLSLGRWRDGLFFFGLLATIILTRGIYHPLWLVSILAAILLAAAKKWKRTAIIGIIPVIACISIYIKNFIIYGTFITGRLYLGINLVVMSLACLPQPEQERLVREGKIWPGSLQAFHPLDYKHDLPPVRMTGIEVLDRAVKCDGFTNWQSSLAHEAGEQYYKDGIYVLKHHPWGYLRYVIGNAKGYFMPSDRFFYMTSSSGRGSDGLVHENAHRLMPLLKITRLVFEGQLGEKPAWLNLLVFPSLVMFAAFLGGSWLVRRYVHGAIAEGPCGDATALTIIYCVFNIIYVFAITTLLSFGDHMRYRFEVSPFYCLFFAMLLQYIWGREREEARNGDAVRRAKV
jgi:hypothetical protein